MSSKRTPNYLLATVLCFAIIYGASANDYERLYSYRADVSLLSPAFEETISQWNLVGTLVLQKQQDKTVAQFRDVKTYAYNGNESEISLFESFKPAKNVGTLTKPFIINFEHGQLDSIFVHEDDSLWSVNIKRALANIFQVNFDKLGNQEIVEEKTLYGTCRTKYEVDHKDGETFLKKTLDSLGCEEDIEKQFQNKPDADCPYLQIPAISRAVQYKYKIKDDEHLITHIATMSKVYHYYNMKYPKEHEEPYHVSFQNQTLILKTAHEIKKPIDTSDISLKKNITFEISEDISQGRRLKQLKPRDELVSEWLNTAQHILKEAANKPTNIKSHGNYVDDYTKLREIATNFQDEKTFEELFRRIKEFKGRELLDLWYSVLPVIGSEVSAEYIVKLCNTVDVEEYDAFSVIAKFPSYLQERNEGTLKKLESLMSLRNETFASIRDIGALNFASLVSHFYKSGSCSSDTYKYYLDKYLRIFKDSNEVESRSVYLLALQNLEADIKLLIPIIRNKTEDELIRSTAIYAVKNQLKNKSEKAFAMFWPMIKDSSLQLQTRVAALDVILNSNLTNEHFLTMYNFLESQRDNDYEELYSYFYSVFQNLNDSASWTHHLTKFLEYLPLDLPKSERVKLTGLYREGFFEQDSNDGTYYETQIVGDLYDDQLSSINLKMNRFGLGMKYASYAVKINFAKMSVLMYNEYLWSHKVPNGIRYDKIAQLLKEYKQLNNVKKETNITVTVYNGEKAIYFAKLIPENGDKVEHFYRGVLQQINQAYSIQYPIIKYVHTASDIGTVLSSEVKMTNGIDHYFFNRSRNLEQGKVYTSEFEYRQISTTNISLTSYNPVDDVNFLISSYQKSESALDLFIDIPFVKLNESSMELKFNTTKNTYYNALADNFVGIYVENEKYLQSHCKGCNKFVKVEKTVTKENSDDPENLIYKYENVIGGIVVTYSAAQCKNYARMKEYFISYFNKLSYNARFDIIILNKIWQSTTDKFFSFKLPDDSCTYSFEIKPKSEEATENYFYTRFEEHYGEVLFNMRLLADSNPYLQTNMTFDSELDEELNKETFTCDITNEYLNNLTKVHIVSEFQLPKKVDIFSMKIADPSYINISVVINPLQSEEKEIVLAMKGQISVSDEQKQNALKTDTWPFKQCAEQSKGLKYTPPTKECIIASQKTSVYHNYTIGLKYYESNFNNSGKPIAQELKPMEQIYSDYYNNITWIMDGELKSNYMSHTFLSNTLSRPVVDITQQMFVKSSLNAYCVVTPNYIQTFGGQITRNYEIKDDSYLFGFFECMEDYGNAFVFSTGNKNSLKREMSMKLWSGGNEQNEIIVTPNKKNVTVLLNGDSINSNYKESNYRVKFLADDFIFIKSKHQEIYYNKEYIMVKVNPSHVYNMCGVCKSQEKQIYL